MTNTQLYEKALEAINELFSDQSVTQTQAKENLTGLRDEILMLLDALEEDE